MKLQQFERVRVTRPVPRYRLPAGAVGTIMDIYEDGAAFEVEFPELEDGDVTATLLADEVAPAHVAVGATRI